MLSRWCNPIPRPTTGATHLGDRQMNATSANDTGMPALLQHCSNVQDKATLLCGVLEAIDTLDNEKQSSNAVTALITVARNMAELVTSDLDSKNLPGARACPPPAPATPGRDHPANLQLDPTCGLRRAACSPAWRQRRPAAVRQICRSVLRQRVSALSATVASDAPSLRKNAVTPLCGLPCGLPRMKNTPQRVVMRGVSPLRRQESANGFYVKQPARGADLL